MKISLINAPEEYSSWLEEDISSQLVALRQHPDFVHVFVSSISDLLIQLKKVKAVISNNSGIIIWVSWYKKSAGVATDVTEDVIRHYALLNNLVDIKVCAVNEQWSALKLVVPVAKR